MQSTSRGYELDVYFKSKRFKKHLNYFKKKGKEYAVPGAIFIVERFQFMPYHYGIIHHYILTGKYCPDKENVQFEIVDYTNRKIASSRLNSTLFKFSDLRTPYYGVHLVLPSGTTQKSIEQFVSNNFKQIKATLNEAYGGQRNKNAFRPIKNIGKYLEIIDKIDKEELTDKNYFELSLEYGVDESDIRKLYKRLGAKNNPYLHPAS